MAVVSYPGVYMEEVSSGVRPIAAASTSVAAFIGEAEKGAIGEAVRVFNFTEYQNEYGGFQNYSFLSHAVYQYFNNGGSQCYVVRVAGEGSEAASITLKDRLANVSSRQPTLEITARSPGAWGNKLAVSVSESPRNPGNEFNLDLYREDEDDDGGTKYVHLEGFEGLSMMPEAPTFVGKVMAASRYVVVKVLADTNVEVGTSVGREAPAVPLEAPRTWLRVSIDDDGYQDVDLAAPNADASVPDLTTPDGIATEITKKVSALLPQHGPETTDPAAFSGFTCSTDSDDRLELSSGVASVSASVRVGRIADPDKDASAQLRLGVAHGGVESSGISVRRPVANAADSYYLVGDNGPAPNEVASVTPGSDGEPVKDDPPFIAALAALDAVQDVSLVAVPGIGSVNVVNAGISYCAGRPLSDCFFVGDVPQIDDTVSEAQGFQDAITPKNSYGAVYMPWVRMVDPTGKSPEPILVPPSGFVAGVYARTDAQRGVWKAPAGTAATLNGAVGLAADLTDPQQGVLNDVNVNVIRRFGAAGIVTWGARTIHSDAEWKYVPVRRMAILLRVSIYNGIQWAVFEPNDEGLWSQLRLNVGAFMSNLFRQGAFQGASADEAYFVKCDGETTTQDDINRGIVNLLVGFAPLKPAEFIVVKISQKAGQS